MRRIKSAPENLSLMVNKKKKDEIVKNNIVSNNIVLTNGIDQTNDIDLKKEILPSNLKCRKKNLAIINNILSDSLYDIKSYINENEIIFITLITTYLSENILKRDKIKMLKEYLIQNIIRYTATYVIHNIIINNDKIQDFIHYIIK